MSALETTVFFCEATVCVCSVIAGTLFVVGGNYGAAIWTLIALGQTLKLLVERYAA